MDYLLEGDITVKKRVVAGLAVIPVWFLGFIRMLFIFTIELIIGTIFKSSSSSSWSIPIFSQSIALLHYSFNGNSEPLRKLITKQDDLEE